MKWLNYGTLTVYVLMLFCITVSSAEDLDAQTRQVGSCFSTEWPHEKSDIRPDPAVVFGRLTNGFRYALMQNSEPKDRIALYLKVGVGSLYEAEDERGIAHYLEHMLFNGTHNFPPGELIKYFQSIGMDFGGDTNAYTSFEETVYKIILPSNSNKEIEDGLLVMADYARGALLLKSETERERNVILAEKRARDSISRRVRDLASRYSLKGTLFPLRKPIGSTQTIEKINSDQLRKFYDAWYQPQNMVLLVVGDYRSQQVEKVIKQRFGSIESAEPMLQCPDIGKLSPKEKKVFYLFEPDLGSTRISIESIWEKEKKVDSIQQRTQDLKRYMVSLLVNNRIESIVERLRTPFIDSSFYVGNKLNRLGYVGLSVKTSPKSWKDSLTAMSIILRQVSHYGFSQKEIDRVKDEIFTYLESEVKKAPTRNSRTLVRRILSSINEGSVWQSPHQELVLYKKIIKDIAGESLLAYYNEMWRKGDVFVEVVGDLELAGDAVSTIEFVYSEAKKQPIDEWKEVDVAEFPYLSVYKVKKTPITHSKSEDIGIGQVRLSNGVLLNYKKTVFKENEVRVRIDIEGGKNIEPEQGYALLAESILGESGSGKLRKSVLDQVIAGSSVRYDINISQSVFSWNGIALQEDMEKLFQVLQTLVLDPGVRRGVYKKVMERFPLYYNKLEKDVNGGDKLYVRRFLAGGNDQFGWPNREQLSSISYEDLLRWVQEEIHRGGLEISVVGDFDEKDLLDYCKKYFGGIAGRKNITVENPKISFPSGERMVKKIDSSVDKAKVTLAWSIDGFVDIKRSRLFHLLAKVFDERLRVEVREELGAAYSPSVYASIFRNLNFGYIWVSMTVDPAQVDIVEQVVLSIADDMYKFGINEEELRRVKGPMLTSLRDMKRNNGYWLNSVLAQSSWHPEQLEWPKSILPDYQNFTAKEVSNLATKYMAPSKAARVTLLPSQPTASLRKASNQNTDS